MKKISFLHKNNLGKNNSNKKTYNKMSKIFFKIFNEINLNLDNTRDTFHVLSKYFKFNFKTKNLKKLNDFKTVVVVGMGGSILGSNAIYDFLKFKIKKKFIFFDNLDNNKLLKFKKENAAKKTLFIIISKSGDTIETLTNFILLKIIKKNAKNLIIISERKSSVLFSISKKYNLYYIEHSNFLGGRYSVLSEVGIIPAYFMGINPNNIRKNLTRYLNTKEKNFLRNSSITLTNMLNKKVHKNIVLLNYAPQLETFLFWCQQLLAESLGKKGKGFLPIISNAPKDHHSLLQLYFDGPKDKIFYIFSIDDNSGDKINIKKISNKISYLNNKNINKIKEAQKKAAIKVLSKSGIPFREFTVKAVNEETLGELFSYFMLETAIVGKMANINPFDQPAVEQVKTFTKKILS